MRQPFVCRIEAFTSLQFNLIIIALLNSYHLNATALLPVTLTCESQIEKGYYNNASDTRSLNLKDICIHCGELDMNEVFPWNETGMDAFLLRQDQLSELGVTNGNKCFPICVDCLKVKKLKIVTTGKKDVAKAREEDARRKA